MGTAATRQQSAMRTGAMSASPVAGGAVPGASSTAPPANEAAAGDGSEDTIPVVFTWAHGGLQVSLAASFKGWQAPIPMVRSGNEFVVVQDVPRGVHQYKFIVDDKWQCAHDQPQMKDGGGNTNNILDISNYQRFQAGSLEEVEPTPRFTQNIPDPTEYTLDAPAIPMVLSKSPLCSVPTRLRGGRDQPSIPLHSLCDHVYIRERAEGEAPCSVVTLAITHRYGQKYSTTIFATRCPGDAGNGDAAGKQGEESDKPKDPDLMQGENLLKKCLLKGLRTGSEAVAKDEVATTEAASA